MNWREHLPGFTTGVLSSLFAMAIGAFLKRSYPTLIEWVSKAVDASRQAASKITSSVIAAYRRASSKISTSFKGISLPAAPKRHIASFAVLGVQVVGVIAYYGFWAVLIVYCVGTVGGSIKTPGASSVSTFQGSTRDYPAPAGRVYSGTAGREWGAVVSPRDCPQRCGVRTQYPARPASYAGESTPVFDCPPALKGRKSKRAIQPCTVEYLPKSGRIGGRMGGGTSYGIVDEPR